MTSTLRWLSLALIVATLAAPASAQPDPALVDDGETTLFWSMERLLRRAPHADNIALDLKVNRTITVETASTYNVDTVAEILEVLPNDRYRVRVGGEEKVYRGRELRRLNLPYLLSDGTRVLAGSSKRSGAIMKIDRANDPVLREFLAEAEKIGRRPLTTEMGKLSRLVDLVNARIKYPGSETPNREAYDRIESNNRGREVHMGEYLKAGQGVCRHKAVAMKLALEAIGYPSRYVAGEALSRGTGEVRGGHAWVEAITSSGKRLMVDPTWHDPGIAMREAYTASSARRPKPGSKRVIPPGSNLPTHMADLRAEMLDPYRRADGTVEWRRMLGERGARELRGLGHFTLALFLKELAVVAKSGDRLRIEEFFDALATTDFYVEYGLFALGARAGEVAYSRYLERFVRPRFVNGILKTNLVLATGLALPQLVSGTFEGKAFAVSLGSLGLSSAAVKSGVRGLAWVRELSSTRRVTTAVRVTRLARVGGFVYAAAELAVVLYLAEEVEGRVNAWLDTREAKAALGEAGVALFEAARNPQATAASIEAAARTYHAAWDAYRDFLYRELYQEDVRLAERLGKSAEAAKISADRRAAAVTNLATHPVLNRSLVRRYGSLEAYAESLTASDEAELAADVDAALSHYQRARDEGLERLYRSDRRATPFLSGVQHLDYLSTGLGDPWGGRQDLLARSGRDRLHGRFERALGDASANKLQTYEDEAVVFAVLRNALARRADLLEGLTPIVRLVELQRAMDQRLAGGERLVDARGAAGAVPGQ